MNRSAKAEKQSFTSTLWKKRAGWNGDDPEHEIGLVFKAGAVGSAFMVQNALFNSAGILQHWYDGSAPTDATTDDRVKISIDENNNIILKTDFKSKLGDAYKED